ncbi:hypothetical protein B0T18DRAFT_389732 [Schizothecium vesticola]|uniref:Uncharacterized protein n=1 Tax=Schizothecium vesticola TaxID=314040 RepID=A0AA40K916_9PEZI|nr:hypothetical protein B0T18DRAFT_389732 [Schizothecium vesticola]
MAPPESQADDKVFWAWNARRTAQHRIRGVTKIQNYQIDVQRWQNESVDLLTGARASPSTSSLDIRRQQTARCDAICERIEAEELRGLGAAAQRAANVARTEHIVDQIMAVKLRPRYRNPWYS